MGAALTPRKPLRLGLIGWGAISRRVAQVLAERRVSVDIVAVGVRDAAKSHDGLPAGVELVTQPEELLGFSFDLVIEAAGRAAVGSWGQAALQRAPAYAVSSTSAFVDGAVLDRLLAVAEAHGSQVVVPPGALAGIDALAAVAALPLDEVIHTIVKPPGAWLGTMAEQLVALGSLTRATTFFSGSAREAADRFPQNANATVITALAGIGLDRTRVVLMADPAATRNSHRLQARGDFGQFDLAIENRPLATNPKSSETTALALVRLVENRVRPLVR
ncbi:MAG TPA: aspartate dehydrogenase [Stellaceae bacterium]|nr:aspartate dehydrogenase [Stellaceae bacterium]